MGVTVLTMRNEQSKMGNLDVKLVRQKQLMSCAFVEQWVQQEQLIYEKTSYAINNVYGVEENALFQANEARIRFQWPNYCISNMQVSA